MSLSDASRRIVMGCVPIVRTGSPAATCYARRSDGSVAVSRDVVPWLLDQGWRPCLEEEVPTLGPPC